MRRNRKQPRSEGTSSLSAVRSLGILLLIVARGSGGPSSSCAPIPLQGPGAGGGHVSRYKNKFQRFLYLGVLNVFLFVLESVRM